MVFNGRIHVKCSRKVHEYPRNRKLIENGLSMQEYLDYLCAKYGAHKKYFFPPKQLSHPKDEHLHQKLDPDSLHFPAFNQWSSLPRFVISIVKHFFGQL